MLHTLSPAALAGDPFRSDFLSLLEADRAPMSAESAAARAETLCRSRDPLIRAIARRLCDMEIGPKMDPQERISPGLQELEGADVPDNIIDRLFLLEHVDLFESLDTDDLVEIASISGEYICPAGEVLYREGDEGDSLYVIVSGGVELHHHGKVIMQLVEGQSVGQVSFLDRGPRPVTARAWSRGETHLLRIERGTLMDLLTDRPGLMHALFGVLASRLRKLIETAPPA